MHRHLTDGRLTRRSTGPIAAGRHLGYKSLAQIPAHRNRPVSLYVRPHTETHLLYSPKNRGESLENAHEFQESLRHRFSINLTLVMHRIKGTVANERQGRHSSNVRGILASVFQKHARRRGDKRRMIMPTNENHPPQGQRINCTGF